MITSRKIKDILGITTATYCMRRIRKRWIYDDIEKVANELNICEQDVMEFIRKKNEKKNE